MTTYNCYSCQKAILDSDVFCPACGRRLQNLELANGVDFSPFIKTILDGEEIEVSKEAVHELLWQLPANERNVLIQVYGLDGRWQRNTLEIVRAEDTTTEDIQTRLVVAATKLRNHSRQIRSYLLGEREELEWGSDQ